MLYSVWTRTRCFPLQRSDCHHTSLVLCFHLRPKVAQVRASHFLFIISLSMLLVHFSGIICSPVLMCCVFCPSHFVSLWSRSRLTLPSQCGRVSQTALLVTRPVATSGTATKSGGVTHLNGPMTTPWCWPGLLSITSTVTHLRFHLVQSLHSFSFYYNQSLCQTSCLDTTTTCTPPTFQPVWRSWLTRCPTVRTFSWIFWCRWWLNCHLSRSPRRNNTRKPWWDRWGIYLFFLKLCWWFCGFVCYHPQLSVLCSDSL